MSTAVEEAELPWSWHSNWNESDVNCVVKLNQLIERLYDADIDDPELRVALNNLSLKDVAR